MKRLREAAALAAFTTLLFAGSSAWAEGQGPGHGGYGPPPPGQYVSPRQRSHWYIGGSVGGFGIMAQVTDNAGYMGQGGGAGGHIGYRFTRMLALEFNLSMTLHDEKLGRFGGLTFIALDNLYLLTSTVDVKIYIPRRSWIEPFFQAGLGYAYLGAAYTDQYCGAYSCDTTFAQGPTYQIGGGIDMWLWRRTNLSVRLLYRGIYFKDAAYGDAATRDQNKNFINGIALDVGATFHF